MYNNVGNLILPFTIELFIFPIDPNRVYTVHWILITFLTKICTNLSFIYYTQVAGYTTLKIYIDFYKYCYNIRLCF